MKYKVFTMNGMNSSIPNGKHEGSLGKITLSFEGVAGTEDASYEIRLPSGQCRVNALAFLSWFKGCRFDGVNPEESVSLVRDPARGVKAGTSGHGDKVKEGRVNKAEQARAEKIAKVNALAIDDSLKMAIIALL